MLVTDLIPARRPDSKRLLVVLHGLGDSMEGWRWLPGMLEIDDLNTLLVNAPDDYHGGYSWYDLYGDSGPGIRRSRELLLQLLDAQALAGFPSEQTSLLGFSQGCLMTLDVGFRYPRRLAGLVGISGYVWDPPSLLREKSTVAAQQRFLFTHGSRDPLIPCNEVKQQVDLLTAGGLPITWRVFDKVHTVAGAEEIDLIRSFLQAPLRAQA
jgi:phospholipase/carboxylesterase